MDERKSEEEGNSNLGERKRIVSVGFYLLADWKNREDIINKGRGRIKIGKSEKEVEVEDVPIQDWTSNLAEAQAELTPAYKFFVRNKAELSEEADEP